MKSHLCCRFMISSKINYRKGTLVHPASAAGTYQRFVHVVSVCFIYLHHLLFCFTQQQNLHQHKDQTFLNKAEAVNGHPEDTPADMEKSA